MNKRIKQQWVAALLGGEYSQTRGSLRDEDGFCCLGVLCDLHAKAGLGEWKPLSDGEFEYNPGACGRGFALPPGVVMRWAGIADPDPICSAIGGSLSYLNDEGKTFAEIAEVIRQEL